MSKILSIQACVREVLADTKNKPELEVQRRLINQAPFHRGQIALWYEYGREIFKQSGRKMFGQQYSDKESPTIKQKRV